MGKGILTGLLEDLKEGIDDLDNDVSDNKMLKVIEPKEVKAFDYNSVDADTAEYLHAKAKEIIRMRLVFTISMANVLEDVHGRLANHYKGTFGKWCESIGISDRTARNYLSVLRWSRENFPNIEDVEKIQPSLLFQISKPSVPLELQEMVLSGDITTHKQYKELESQLKAREKERDWEADKARENYMAAQEAEKRTEDAENELMKVKKQLLEAQASGDSEEVEKLNILLEDTVRELEASRDKIKELELQLNDNTEIATAVVEKVPDEIYEELEELRKQSLSTKSIEVSSEISALLKLINSSITSIISIIHKVDREGDIKGNIFNAECLWQINMFRDKISKLNSFSAEKLNIQPFYFIKD